MESSDDSICKGMIVSIKSTEYEFSCFQGAHLIYCFLLIELKTYMLGVFCKSQEQFIFFLGFLAFLHSKCSSSPFQ